MTFLTVVIGSQMRAGFCRVTGWVYTVIVLGYHCLCVE